MEEYLSDRLLQAFLNMKNNFEQQVRSLDGHLAEAQLEYFKEMFDTQKSTAADCLNGIDQKVLDCLAHIEQYKRIHSALSSLNEKLSQLGVEPFALPEALPAEDLGSIITSRIEMLRSQGRV